MTFAGLFSGQDYVPPDYEIKHNSLKTTATTPQIVEGVSTKGIPIYIRFKDGQITCRNKKTNEIICQGSPFLYKEKAEIPIDQIEFYLEMYSKHKIQFII